MGNDAPELTAATADAYLVGEPLGAPIRVGWASPLRVATGGDANCSSEARRRRSPAHANRRRDCVILSMNVGPSIKLIEGQNLFPSNCLIGIATLPVDLRVQAHSGSNWG